MLKCQRVSEIYWHFQVYLLLYTVLVGDVHHGMCNDSCRFLLKLLHIVGTNSCTLFVYSCTYVQ